MHMRNWRFVQKKIVIKLHKTFLEMKRRYPISNSNAHVPLHMNIHSIYILNTLLRIVIFFRASVNMPKSGSTFGLFTPRRSSSARSATSPLPGPTNSRRTWSSKLCLTGYSLQPSIITINNGFFCFSSNGVIPNFTEPSICGSWESSSKLNHLELNYEL